MNKKKTVITAVVLSLVVLVGGLLAYFTDKKEATNTFTIGNVAITLTEPSWVPANAQGLTPNAVVAKDPTVKVTGSNPAYLFLKVSVPRNPEVAGSYSPLFTYTANSAWAEVTPKTALAEGTKVYVYKGDADAMKAVSSADTQAPALFNNVTLANITKSISENQDIVVTAYGIQADNLGDAKTPAEVWDLVKGL